jgi:hypothetical protein
MIRRSEIGRHRFANSYLAFIPNLHFLVLFFPKGYSTLSRGYLCPLWRIVMLDLSA